jgi:hypothetical protein
MPSSGMNAGKMVFSQLTEWVPHYEFQRLVERYQGDYKVREFSCWEQFLCMMFAQLTYRDSLRDIESCLRSRSNLLYHLGLRSSVARSTLADANERRDWRIYADLAQKLIARARRLYAQDPLAVELDETVYALDSTTIDLCLELFPWARFRRHKAAIKLHTLLDLRGAIPTLIYLSDGKLHDVNFLDELPLEAGAYYVLDRGYVDFGRLHRFVLEGAFFVTRAKRHLRYRVRESRPLETDSGVRADQVIQLTGTVTRKSYPERLRRVRYYDAERKKTLVFLTNIFTLPARVIAQLYKCRWQIELFFKWIKQNLKIKTFYGYSDNAVRSQVWIAVCTYVLVAIVKKELKLEVSLSQMLQIISVSIFEKVPLPQLLANNGREEGLQNSGTEIPKQLVFNNL